MSEDSKGFSWAGRLLTSLILGVLLTGVSFVLFEDGGFKREPTGEASLVSQGATTTTASMMATTTILLGVSAPKAASDKLIALTLPAGTFADQTVPTGWRWTSLREVVDLRIQSGKDGTLFLVGAGWNVPLRLRNGRALDETHLIGRLDKDRAIITARQDGRAVYLITKFGEVRKLFSLSDTMEVLDLSGGSVWVSTFQMGEGIESPPRGPSTLIRVTGDGVTSTMMTSDQVITSVMMAPHATSTFLVRDEIKTTLFLYGKEKWMTPLVPLVWLDASHYLLSEGTVIKRASVDQALFDVVTTLPSVPSFAIISSTQ
ncbi:MAG: hypothetical protein Q7R83_00945 [bacterium]|nr:hypothetical protein [bacterium]